MKTFFWSVFFAVAICIGVAITLKQCGYKLVSEQSHIVDGYAFETINDSKLVVLPDNKLRATDKFWTDKWELVIPTSDKQLKQLHEIGLGYDNYLALMPDNRGFSTNNRVDMDEAQMDDWTWTWNRFRWCNMETNDVPSVMITCSTSPTIRRSVIISMVDTNLKLSDMQSFVVLVTWQDNAGTIQSISGTMSRYAEPEKIKAPRSEVEGPDCPCHVGGPCFCGDSCRCDKAKP